MRKVRNRHLDVDARNFPTINGALAVGRDVYVSVRNEPYTVDAPLSLADGQRLYGIGPEPPVIELTQPELLNASGVDNAELDFLRFEGPHSGTSYAITLLNCAGWLIRDVTFAEGNSGIDVAGCSNMVFERVALREMLGTGIKFRNGSTGCVLREVEARNVSNFGVLVEDADHIDIRGLRKHLSEPDLTAELQGQLDSGRIGLEGLGVRIAGSHVTLFQFNIQDCHDNGISFTGSHCVAREGRITNCHHDGLRMYGSYNVAEAVRVSGCAMNGIAFGGNAGGFGQLSRADRCVCDGNGIDGVQFDTHSYRVWVADQVSGSVVNYCLSSVGTTHRVYRSASGPTDTFGGVQPVHESGTVSDGVNDWEYVSKLVADNADARWNAARECAATGNTGDEFNDRTAAANANTFIP